MSIHDHREEFRPSSLYSSWEEFEADVDNFWQNELSEVAGDLAHARGCRDWGIFNSDDLAGRFAEEHGFTPESVKAVIDRNLGDYAEQIPSLEDEWYVRLDAHRVLIEQHLPGRGEGIADIELAEPQIFQWNLCDEIMSESALWNEEGLVRA